VQRLLGGEGGGLRGRLPIRSNSGPLGPEALIIPRPAANPGIDRPSFEQLAIRFANSENATKFKEEFDAGKKLHAAATGGASKGTPAKEQKKEDTAEKKDTPKKEAEDKKADEAAAAIEAVKIDGEKKD
jgi:hypothetical protein